MLKTVKRCTALALLSGCVLFAAPMRAEAAPSIQDIRNYYQTNAFNPTAMDTYSVTPDPATENPGVLSDATRTNTTNALNFVRYVAGLDAVTYDVATENKVQAGTTLLQITGRLSHYPTKPAHVSQAFFDLGYAGTSSSNLGSGYNRLTTALFFGWMNDGDRGNIADLGHRRWILDPRMSTVAFGHTGSYTGMHSFGMNWGKPVPQPYVAWPAENMPHEFFSGPWSVSLTQAAYQVPSPTAVTVTMTNLRTNAVYNLNNSHKNPSGNYLNVSTAGFGYGKAVSFKPDTNFQIGDIVRVRIDGLTDNSGNAKPLEYTVTFFSITGTDIPTLDQAGPIATNSNAGSGSNSGGNSMQQPATNSNAGYGDSSGNRSGGSNTSSARSSADGIYDSPKVSSGSSGGTMAENSSTPKPSDRWIQKDGKWILRNEVTKAVAKDTWKQINGIWYRFDPEGIMETGWKKINDRWYYFSEEKNEKEGAMQRGWVKWKDGWFFLSLEEGSEEGRLLTGWFSFDNKTYYLEPQAGSEEGKMKTGWMDLDGKRYYFSTADGSEEGKLLTGWQDLGDKRYFFSENPSNSYGAMTTGWAEIGGKFYFFSRTKGSVEGMMLRDRVVEGYRLGADGARVSAVAETTQNSQRTRQNSTTRSSTGSTRRTTTRSNRRR